MGTLGRYVAGVCLLRVGAVAAVVAVVGALVGGVEASSGGFGGGFWESLGRVPETVFFAAPVVVAVGLSWGVREVVHPGVAEGLEGAGVPGGRVDRGVVWAGAVAVVLAVGLGGWVAPWAQRAAAADARAAWARSGGGPGWASSGWTWVRSGEVLVRVERTGEGTRATARIDLGDSDGPLALPPASDLDLLTVPPAWMSWPELAEASVVRRRWGHPAAPVAAEWSLRFGLVLLVIPAVWASVRLRREPSARRRWPWVVAVPGVGLLGLQAATVWAARGELPFLVPAAAGPLAAALVLAALPGPSRSRPRR